MAIKAFVLAIALVGGGLSERMTVGLGILAVHRIRLSASLGMPRPDLQQSEPQISLVDIVYLPSKYSANGDSS